MSNELPPNSELTSCNPNKPQVDRWRVWRTRVRKAIFSFIVILPFIAVGEIILCSSLLSNFMTMDGHRESVDIKGIDAIGTLGYWPPAITPQNVDHLSHQIDWSGDSVTERYRMEITAGNAAKWQDDIHADEERNGHGLSHLYVMEGIHRSIVGPPPLEHQTGSSPSWWTPPDSDYRATEFMLWSHSKGTAHGLYSVYEPRIQTLWVYGYSAEHNELWPAGKLPAGAAFQPSNQ